jgi:hypothetical protein
LQQRQLKLEELHYQIWQYAKADYKTYATQIVGFKKESLISSQKARRKTIEDRLEKENDPRIIRMKLSQLASQQRSFDEKMEELSSQIQKSDIVTRKLVVGMLKVEN